MWKWLFGASLHQKADRLSTYAAALAYCLVLSLVPFLVVTFTFGSAIAPKLNWGKPFEEVLNDIFPSNVLHPARIVATLESSSHRGLATLGFILAVYTSYRLMTQIVRTLIFIFDDSRRAQEWNWTVAGKSAALFVIWMMLLLVISICSFFLLELHHALKHGNGLPLWWMIPARLGTDAMMAAALFAAFFLTYSLVSTRRFPGNHVRGGSLIATIGWIAGSVVFSDILPRLWSFSTVYQALGSFVVILIWAQVCAWAIILGAGWIVRFSPRRKSA